MRKLTDQSLIELLDAFDAADHSDDHDYSRFVFAGYAMSDIRKVYKARSLIIDNPSLSEWDLVAHDIQWSFQQESLGGLGHFKTLLGYELTENDQVQDIKKAKGRVLMALWKALSAEHYVLASYDLPNQTISFKRRKDGLNIDVIFYPPGENV